MTLNISQSRNQELKEKLSELKEKIAEELESNNRPRDAAKLLAVSKTHPVNEIAALAKAGHLDFGENKVQELLQKQADWARYYPELKVRWHLIGHLQRNKVRQIVGQVYLIHSVDSMRLLKELEKRAAQAGVKQRILLQFNVSGELSKQGFEPEELEAVLEYLKQVKQLEFSGLMTMAPYDADSSKLRKYFSRLRELSELAQKEFPEANELSMGMSGDYPEAIAEGSTMLRIGSAIFGQRNY